MKLHEKIVTTLLLIFLFTGSVFAGNLNTPPNAKVTAVPVNYDIVATSGPNGVISPSGIVSVPETTDQTFTITPDACYSIADVLVDGVSVGPVSTYTFTNVTSAHTIAAVFTLTIYNITASAGANGSISPNAVVGVGCGNDQTFTITPDACYAVADVLVDGVSVGAVGTYTFTNVNGIHTIDASFVQITYDIDASAAANGSISPIGITSVNCGTDQTYTITPDACYEIADVVVDGNPQGPLSTYTFTGVNSNHTIEASFIQTTYSITANAAANGNISSAGTTAVGCGTDMTYTITPDACYEVADVIVDGVSQGPLSTFTFISVSSAHTIDVTFSQITYNITASSGANGSVAPSGTTAAGCGTDQVYTITPDANYAVQDVLVDGVSVGTPSVYTFTSVGANHTISASFFGVLPVTLRSFTAIQQQKNNVLLNWQTDDEINITGYDIEMAKGSGEYSSAGNVTANATSATNSYQFTVPNLAPGIYYFRLKIISVDGRPTYSQIRPVKIGGDKNEFVSIYPNPTSDGFVYINGIDPASKSVTINIVDGTGRVVSTLNSGNSTPLKIKLPEASGIYSIRITTNDGNTIIKQAVRIF